MPLWLDLLRTPMAAPESDGLHAMRRTWQILCVMCAVTVPTISYLVALFGRPASIMAAALLLMTAIYTALYVTRKNRADDAHLAAAIEDRP